MKITTRAATLLLARAHGVRQPPRSAALDRRAVVDAAAVDPIIESVWCMVSAGAVNSEMSPAPGLRMVGSFVRIVTQ